MSALISSIVAFILGGLAILGLVPHQQMQPVPQIPQDNTAPIVQQTALPAPTNPINTNSPSSNNDLRIYTDSQHRFSVEYPSALNLQTSNLEGDNSLSTNQSTDPSAEKLISVRYGPETLTIGVSPDPKDVGNCMVAPQMSESSVNRVSTIVINGVPFLTYEIGGVGLGQYMNDKVYHTIKNNACWTITEETQGVEDNRLSPEQVTAQNDALATAAAQINPIVQSFKFITSPGDKSQPPTCNLSNDKFTYTLGDVIHLTWTSKVATRALWHQPVEQGTGLRKLIVPPSGTPDTNGTASTVANVEGYQSIALQVVGPGGFGTCSTQVSVSHSSAKPSITVDSGSIKGSTAGGPNVTINGTATNGALYNDAINLVLFDANYAGPFDEASVYKYAFANPRSTLFFSGGTAVDLREDSLPFENWSVKAYAPAGTTRVRILAYPFYSSSVNSPTQPLVNVVLTITQ